MLRTSHDHRCEKMDANRLCFRSILVAAALLSAVDALAVEYPDSGVLYNTKGTSFINYSCQLHAGEEIDCEFTQTYIAKKASEGSLDKYLQQAKKEYPTFIEGFGRPECGLFKKMLLIIQGRVDVPDSTMARAVEQMSEEEKQDKAEWLDAFISACELRTEEEFLNVVRKKFHIDSRTCRVYSTSFKQRFRHVRATTSSGPSWVASNPATGTCEEAQPLQFEGERPEWEPGATFWSLIIAEGSASDQEGAVSGSACPEPDDQNGQRFSWRGPREHTLNCVYVDFSDL